MPALITTIIYKRLILAITIEFHKIFLENIRKLF
jgi:hypothetical protein